MLHLKAYIRAKFGEDPLSRPLFAALGLGFSAQNASGARAGLLKLATYALVSACADVRSHLCGYVRVCETVCDVSGFHGLSGLQVIGNWVSVLSC